MEETKKAKTVHASKADGKERELATHEITEVLAGMHKSSGEEAKARPDLRSSFKKALVPGKRQSKGKQRASPAAQQATQVQMQSAGGASASGGSVQYMELQKQIQDLKSMITGQQMSGGGGGGMLPQGQCMPYGPRVVAKRQPLDPHDKSPFTINVPQGAKSIIKQASNNSNIACAQLRTFLSRKSNASCESHEHL